MSKLSLEKYSFVLLDYIFPPEVQFYELQNSSEVDGKPDFTKLNTYISRDNNFFNIWHGLLESLFTENALNKKGVKIPEDIDLGL